MLHKSFHISIGLFMSSLLLNIANATPLNSLCSTHRISHIDNSNVQVWSTVICPHQALAFHTHKYPRIIISQEDGELKIPYKNGKTKYLKLKMNIPIYLSKAQGITPHKDINTGDVPLHITVIGLKMESKK